VSDEVKPIEEELSDKDKELVNRFLQSAAWEARNATDRAAAIILSTLLEDRLETAIRSRLFDSPKVQKRFFTRAGASFASKIDLGYLIGMYPEQLLEAFHSIREIRNTFAHSTKFLTFENADVKKKLVSLDKMFNYIDELVDNPSKERVGLSSRRRFENAAAALTGVLVGLQLTGERIKGVGASKP
jgi:hypothetical protein